jgi:hypothetical protein
LKGTIMPTQTTRTALLLAFILSLLMWATRGSHVLSATHLPDASWAIFFALGFYFRQRLVLPLFLMQAALIDYLAIAQWNGSDYCVTAAYAFLLPAYAALWLAGRWYAAQYRFEWRTLSSFALAGLLGTTACELISHSSFYFLGGRVVAPSFAGFMQSLAQYFPQDLTYTALYLAAAALAHVLLHTAQRHPATA